MIEAQRGRMRRRETVSCDPTPPTRPIPIDSWAEPPERPTTGARMAGPAVIQMNNSKKAASLRNLGIDHQRPGQNLDGLVLTAVPAGQSKIGCHPAAIEDKGERIALEPLRYGRLGPERFITQRLAKGGQGCLDSNRRGLILGPDMGNLDRRGRVARRERSPMRGPGTVQGLLMGDRDDDRPGSGSCNRWPLYRWWFQNPCGAPPLRWLAYQFSRRLGHRRCVPSCHRLRYQPPLLNLGRPRPRRRPRFRLPPCLPCLRPIRLCWSG